jgi:hypothetical protein
MVLARCIEGLSHHLEYASSGVKNPLRGPTAKQTRKWQKFRDEEVGSVTRDSNDSNTYGLHLNFSLRDRTTGKNIFDAHGIDMDSVYILNATSQAFEQNISLLLTNEAAQRRHHKRMDGEFNFNVKIPEASFYVENKLPAASCNPYYAVMLQLIAIRRMMQQHLERNEDGQWGIKEILEIPDQKETHYIALDLNELKPGLGDQFEAALQALPPGSEKSSQQKIRERAMLSNGR